MQSQMYQPKQFKTHNLDKSNIRDHDVWRYIFDRVLYPLENALLTAYGISPYMLHVGPEQQSNAVAQLSGSFDGEESGEVDDYHNDVRSSLNVVDRIEGQNASRSQCWTPDYNFPDTFTHSIRTRGESSPSSQKALWANLTAWPLSTTRTGTATATVMALANKYLEGRRDCYVLWVRRLIKDPKDPESTIAGSSDVPVPPPKVYESSKAD
ncbi:hypothetical protein GGTG_06345 [Gaeumannomyces tritici R3-111a-1]|uniref:Uncharacterized protein n=1 Tax=Gaeumannomyces tritici (strain R3-111a-1) TaxID=644352 RepID=J3NYJ3_GAET3|nr:hypothetical protein GGTG_06345 [Gaeumannomyces tritici R3-111a-1]EJT76426.1 hypothetical protein GGTG_06345 [Gaeumannomyces tritici R3-111a-1]